MHFSANLSKRALLFDFGKTRMLKHILNFSLFAIQVQQKKSLEMMQEMEKLFETLRDDFNRKLSTADSFISYFTTDTDSIEHNVAYSGSFTDSFEDISLTGDVIHEETGSSSEINLDSSSNCNSKGLMSIDSEIESSTSLHKTETENNLPNKFEFMIDDYDTKGCSNVDGEDLTPVISYVTDNPDEIQDEEIQDKLTNPITKIAHVNLIIEDNSTDVKVETTLLQVIDEYEQIDEIIDDPVVEPDIFNEYEKISDCEIIENEPANEFHVNNSLAGVIGGQSHEAIADNEPIKKPTDNENESNDYLNEIMDSQETIESGENKNIDAIEDNNTVSKYKYGKKLVERNQNNELDKISENKENREKLSGEPDSPRDKNVKQSESVRLRKTSSDKSVPRKQLKHYSSVRRMWSDMEEVINSEVLKISSKKEIQLQEAMFEIITSEASYYQSLMILTNHFFDSELFRISDDKDNIVSPIDKHHIFSNVMPIMKTSSNLLNDLEQRWRTEKPILSQICDIVYIHAASEAFQSYVTYLRNQQYQTQALRRLSENESFKIQLSKLEASPVCGKLALDSFLMLPMQRLTRLKMLVEAVSKIQNCEDLSDKIPQSTKDVTIKALEEIKKLLNTSNTQKGLMDQKGALISLINKIDFSSNIKRITFSDKTLIQEDEVKIHQQNAMKTIRKFSKKKQPIITLLLFNDLLMIAKKKGSRLLVLDYCNKSNVKVTSVIITQDVSSTECSSTASATDIRVEPQLPQKSSGPTLMRSKTSLSADEKKRLSIPLSNSFMSMPSINKPDDQETKDKTFSLQLSEGLTDIFTNAVYLIARNKKERDFWIGHFNGNQLQAPCTVITKPTRAKLHKSTSLKLHQNISDLSLMTKSCEIKKTRDA